MTPTEFWEKVDRSGACWLWTGSIHPETGYGLCWFEGRSQSVHRVAWKLRRGKIPRGKLVLHKPPCRTRHCVRHLYLGTHRDNILDAIRAGTYAPPTAYGEDIAAAKLTANDVRQIRRIYTGRYGDITMLARDFGVSRSAIKAVVHGIYWKHLH
jgi:hypothetical protein